MKTNERTVTGALLAAVALVALPGEPARGQAEGLKEKVKEKLETVDRGEALQKASEALQEAREKRGAELALERLNQVARSDEALRLRQQAKEAMKRRMESESAEALVERATNDAVLRNVKENLSEKAAALVRASAMTPPPVPGGAGAFLMAQNNAVGEEGEVDPGKVVVPPKQEPGEPPKPEKEEVTIKARDVAYFDANSKVAIFEGKVEVDHPGFDIFCDKLEVFFKKDDAAEGAEAEGGDGAGSDLEKQSGEIDMVRATGREVLIHKLGSNGQMQIGKCKEAIYYAENGRVEMMVWPQVQQGQYIIMATEEGTKMVFDRNGEMNVLGASESRFVRDLKTTE